MSGALKQYMAQLPPAPALQANESECTVIGVALAHPAKFGIVRDLLVAADFFNAARRAIFEAMVELDAAGEPIDVPAVVMKLRELGMFEQLNSYGGGDYLADLAASICTTETVAFHCRKVKEASNKRKDAEVFAQLALSARTDVDRAEFLDHAADLVARRRDALAPPTIALPALHSRIVTVDGDWYTSPPPPRTWLLRDARSKEQAGWLPQAKAGLLIAEGGVGKTIALMQLATAIAKNGAWFNTFPVETAGRVFMLLGEEEAEEARRRIFNAHAGVGSPPPPGSIVILPMAGAECAFLMRDERGGATETAFAHDLREYLVKNGPWATIICEPVSRVGGPDAETDTAAATRLVQYFESLAEATGATVLGAHHTNKVARNGGAVDAKASRGASALTDGFRWVASLQSHKTEALGKAVTLAVVKSNYSFEGDPLVLRRADGGRLEPISAQELAAYQAESSGATARKQRAETSEEEREEALARREEREATKRAEREQANADKAQAKRHDEERAAVEILRQKPGIHTDELRSALAAALGGCTRDRMRDILARLGAKVVDYRPSTGPANARAYRLAESP